MKLREVFSVVEKDLNKASGYRFIRNNVDKDVVAHWSEPGIFAIVIYRSVGRLFARAIATTPLSQWEYRRIYEVGIEPAIQFISDHGGFVDEKEVKNLGIGDEIARVSMQSYSFFRIEGKEEWYGYQPKTFLFTRKGNDIRIYSGRCGLLSPVSKWELKEFNKEYAQAAAQKPERPPKKGDGHIFVKSNDIPEECLAFMARKVLLEDA